MESKYHQQQANEFYPLLAPSRATRVLARPRLSYAECGRLARDNKFVFGTQWLLTAEYKAPALKVYNGFVQLPSQESKEQKLGPVPASMLGGQQLDALPRHHDAIRADSQRSLVVYYQLEELRRDQLQNQLRNAKEVLVRGGQDNRLVVSPLPTSDVAAVMMGGAHPTFWVIVNERTTLFDAVNPANRFILYTPSFPEFNYMEAVRRLAETPTSRFAARAEEAVVVLAGGQESKSRKRAREEAAIPEPEESMYWSSGEQNLECDHVMKCLTYFIQKAECYGVPLLRAYALTVLARQREVLILEDYKRTLGGAPPTVFPAPQEREAAEPAPKRQRRGEGKEEKVSRYYM